MDKSSMRGGAKLVSGTIDSEGVETISVSPEDEGAEETPEPEPEAEAVEWHSDGSVTVYLQHAFLRPPLKGKDAAEDITKIVFREMTAGDLVDMDRTENESEKLIALASALSSTPASLLHRLHFEDYALVHGVLNDKLGKFLRVSARVLSRSRVG